MIVQHWQPADLVTVATAQRPPGTAAAAPYTGNVRSQRASWRRMRKLTRSDVEMLRHDFQLSGLAINPFCRQMAANFSKAGYPVDFVTIRDAVQRASHFWIPQDDAAVRLIMEQRLAAYFARQAAR